MYTLHGTYLDVREAGSLLGIDETLVTRYCRQNRFSDVVKIGSKWLIEEQSVEEFARQPRPRGKAGADVLAQQQQAHHRVARRRRRRGESSRSKYAA